MLRRGPAPGSASAQLRPRHSEPCARARFAAFAAARDARIRSLCLSLCREKRPLAVVTMGSYAPSDPYAVNRERPYVCFSVTSARLRFKFDPLSFFNKGRHRCKPQFKIAYIEIDKILLLVTFMSGMNDVIAH